MAPLGLRDRKKQETRLALRTAALRLTAERGLDGFTVEDVAAAVHVSSRTFFNYYGSKESAIVGLEPGAMDQVISLLAARPLDEEPLLSLHAVLREIAGQVEGARELYLLRTKVVADNPSLLPRHIASFVEFERALVAGLRERAPSSVNPTADAPLVVACAVAALRVSVDTWIDREGEQLLPHIDRAFAQLTSGLVSPISRAPSPRTTKHTKGIS